MVVLTGFAPVTFRVSGGRSPPELQDRGILLATPVSLPPMAFGSCGVKQGTT